IGAAAVYTEHCTDSGRRADKLAACRYDVLRSPNYRKPLQEHQAYQEDGDKNQRPKPEPIWIAWRFLSSPGSFFTGVTRFLRLVAGDPGACRAPQRRHLQEAATYLKQRVRDSKSTIAVAQRG